MHKEEKPDETNSSVNQNKSKKSDLSAEQTLSGPENPPKRDYPDEESDDSPPETSTEVKNAVSEEKSPQGELSTDEIENIDELLNEAGMDVEEREEEEEEPHEDGDDEVKIVSVKELTERTVKRNTIEAALLAAQRPIGIEEMSIKLEMGKVEIERLLQELAEDYMDRTTAIEIVRIGEGYSMQIKPEYTEKIVKFASGGLIPKAVMRTLTIIAVKQPLLKSLLVKMRGSTAYDHCSFLIDRGYITTYKKGRSSILETTDQFADTFGLSRDVETLKKQLIEQLGILPSEETAEDEQSLQEGPTLSNKSSSDKPESLEDEKNHTSEE